MHAQTGQHTYQNKFLQHSLFLNLTKPFFKQTCCNQSISKILYQVKSVESSNMDVSLNTDLFVESRLFLTFILKIPVRIFKR